MEPGNNVPITPGTGLEVAADNVADGVLGTDVKVQYVKIMGGTIGDTTKVASTANGLAVDPSGVTSPVAVASLPLPAGASTSANQTTSNTSLASIDGKTPSLVSGRQPVDGSGVTQPVSAASLPLPAGAATSALQTSGNTSLTTIATNTPTVGQKSSAASAPVVIAGDQSTVPVSAASLPLPSGAATATNLTGGAQKTQVVDGSGNVITSTGNALDINIKSGGSTGSSSTASGSGGESYSNTRGSFTATPTTSANTITLASFITALSGITLSAANFVSGSIKRITSSGLVSSLPLTTVAYNSGTGVLTLADMVGSFAAGDMVEVTITGPHRAYDKPNDLTKTSLGSLIAGEDLTNNVLGTLQKPVVGTQYAPGNYQNATTGTTANIKAAAGNVLSIKFSNANAAARYIQLHNTATTPTAGAAPQLWFELAGGTAAQPADLTLDSTYFSPSEYFSAGIAWAASTTPTTYTAATAGDHNLHVRYV